MKQSLSLDAVIGRFRKEPPIGIDISNESIIIVELRVSKNRAGIELVRLGMAPTPENAVRDGEVVNPTVVAEKIKEIMKAHDFKAKKAITAVSGQAAIIRPRIRFPNIPLKELKEVVMHDAERYIPFPIQDVYIDFQVLGTVEEDGISKYEVLLVTAQKQLIDTYSETFASAGLDLTAVDVASFSVMRALSGSQEEIGADQLAVLILIRGETTDLTVIKNGAPLFARSIPIGSSTLIEIIASNMNLELDEAIEIYDRLSIAVSGDEVFDDPKVEQASIEIRPTLKDLTTEIQKSIEYFHQSQQEPGRVQQLILADRGAKLKNLDRYFEQVLGIDVEIGNPIQFLSFDEAQFPLAYLTENATTFATAIGLARRGLEEN